MNRVGRFGDQGEVISPSASTTFFYQNDCRPLKSVRRSIHSPHSSNPLIDPQKTKSPRHTRNVLFSTREGLYTGLLIFAFALVANRLTSAEAAQTNSFSSNAAIDPRDGYLPQPHLTGCADTIPRSSTSFHEEDGPIKQEPPRQGFSSQNESVAESEPNVSESFDNDNDGDGDGDGDEVTTDQSEKLQVEIIKNEVYQSGIGRAGQCDVFLPSTRQTDRKLPVVILVHGGGWIGGDKWNLKNYAYQLAENGFFALTINYRHAPKHRFPAQVDDVRYAMLWLQSQYDRFPIDLSRLGMFGYSAGGHLTALVSSVANQNPTIQSQTSHWEKADPRWQQLPKIRAICIGGPPCNFQSLPLDNTSMKFFLGDSRRNAPDIYRAASPLAHVSEGDPPTMIIHGETDIMVPLQSSQVFHEAQTTARINSQLKVLPKQGHFLTFLNPETAKQMILHFQKHLGI